MKLWEAMKFLEEGKKVRRTDWTSCFYLQRGSDGTIFHEKKESEFCIEEWLLVEWELYEESQKTYIFMEVVAGLKEGKAFKRKSWIATLSIKSFASGLVLNDFGLPHLTIQDFEATDWIEVKE